jgi:hypothetical protein
MSGYCWIVAAIFWRRSIKTRFSDRIEFYINRLRYLGWPVEENHVITK